MIYSEYTGEPVHPKMIDVWAHRMLRLGRTQVTVSCILKSDTIILFCHLFSTETIYKDDDNIMTLYNIRQTLFDRC